MRGTHKSCTKNILNSGFSAWRWHNAKEKQHRETVRRVLNTRPRLRAETKTVH